MKKCSYSLLCALLVLVVFCLLTSRNSKGFALRSEETTTASKSVSSLSRSRDFFVAGRAGERLAFEAVMKQFEGNGEVVQLLLPNGESLAASVVRRERSVAGELDLVEGVVSEPVEGRFLFQRQPEGSLPGPFWGFVYYPALDTGWGITNTARGSWLVEKPADALACRKYEVLAGEEEVLEFPEFGELDISIPPYQNGVVPLESLPGAVAVLYIDFDGEEGPHAGWGDFYAEPHSLSNTQRYDIWRRVAEDFAPFNINVTTDLAVYEAAPKNARQRNIHTRTNDAAPGAGGVAYGGSFNGSSDSPCWSFNGGTKSAAETISHEFGHTLRLGHDGDSGRTYYSGHGSGETRWGPIMGGSFRPNLTQWSKGEYADANNTQDDLEILTNNNNEVDYRIDDHGAGSSTASALGFLATGEVSDTGVIETDGDVDSFLFVTSGGSIALQILPAEPGPNLDLEASLYDESNNLLLLSNPVDEVGASLATDLPAGSYTVRVTNVGKEDVLGTGYSSYASLGKYSVNGSLAGAVLPDFLAVAENSALGSNIGPVTPDLNHGGNTLSFAISSGNELGLFAINGAGELTVAAAIDYEAFPSLFGDTLFLPLEISVVDTVDPLLNETIQAVIEIANVNEAPTLQSEQLRVLERTRTGRVIGKLVSSDPDHNDFPSWQITSGNGDGAFGIDGNGHLFMTAGLEVGEDTARMLSVEISDKEGLTASATITVEVLDTVAGYEPGGITHTFYRGLSGNSLSTLTNSSDFPRNPDDFETRDEIHSNGDGNNYGRVARGYLIPPVTGEYVFWVAGDDGCELLLSTDESEANVVSLASFSGHTGYQFWDKYSSQQSVPVTLQGGQAYYLEARQKEGGGGDHLSVAWEISRNGNVVVAREPVPGLFLAPFEMNFQPGLENIDFAVRENAVKGFRIGNLVASDLNGSDGAFFSSSSPLVTVSSEGVIRLVAPGLLPAAGETTTLEITVTDDGAPALSSVVEINLEVLFDENPNGEPLVWEIWNEISGTKVADLIADSRFPDAPDDWKELVTVDTGEDYGGNYGSRLQGWLTPSESGEFTLAISGDDETQLWLSSDSRPDNKSLFARVSGWSAYQTWNKYDSQLATVSLVSGTRYYFEVLHKEGGGGDHFSLGWQPPGGTEIEVVSESAVEGYDANQAPVMTGTEQLVLAGVPQTLGHTPFVATDPNGDELTWAIAEEVSPFEIDSVTGELSLSGSGGLVAGSNVVTILAQDNGANGRFPLKTTSRFFELVVSTDNAAPGLADASFSVAEGRVAGTILGTLAGSDEDKDDVLSYEIVGGNSEGLFSLNSASGLLTVDGVLNFEAGPGLNFELLVRVSDGVFSDTATVSINVIDLDESLLGGLQAWEEAVSLGNPATMTRLQSLGGQETTTVDLSGLSGSATFEFLVDAEDLSQDTLNLLGGNGWSLRFEQWSDAGELGVTHSGVADYRFTSVNGESLASPYGTLSHLVYVLDEATGETVVYLNGIQVGMLAQIPDLAIMDATLGDVELRSGSNPGILAFAAYNIALDASEVGSHYRAWFGLPLDLDGDGLDDNWELDKFESLTAQVATSDQDGDGLAALIEFALGSDPTAFTSNSTVTESLEYEFVMSEQSAAYLTCMVQGSRDLGSWTDLAIRTKGEDWSSLGGTMITSEPAPSGRREYRFSRSGEEFYFYRLQVRDGR